MVIMNLNDLRRLQRLQRRYRQQQEWADDVTRRVRMCQTELAREMIEIMGRNNGEMDGAVSTPRPELEEAAARVWLQD